MSGELFKTLQRINDLERMPQLGGTSKCTNEALRLLVNGEQVSVSCLKVQVEDIQEGRVTIAFAFCDKDDRPIVNIGRCEFLGAGSTLKISDIANSLNFTVT